MMDWGALTWGLFSLFAVLFVGGLLLGGWALAHRFGGGSRKWRVLTPLVVGLIAVGLTGGLVVTALGSGGLMHHMMGMGSMMGAGATERLAPDPVAGAPKVRVIGTEFSFSPSAIRLDAGETVNLVFENDGHMFHTLTIGELGFELRAGGGDSIAGALRVERPGDYSFICAVPGHAEAGMRATITVT